jgi:membrane protease YdiL (CAAX protease family)
MGMLVFAVFCIADGIIADYVYEKTECIWIPALFHGAINSTGIGILFDNECHPERSIFGPDLVGMISMLPTVAFAVYLLYKEKYYEREY